MNNPNFKSYLSQILDHKLSIKAPQKDYFSWGRDPRHILDDSEDIQFNNKKNIIKRQLKKLQDFLMVSMYSMKSRFKTYSPFVLPKKYKEFESSFNLLSDDFSRQLFCEILLLKFYGEDRISLSSFTKEFVDSYEKCSSQILNEQESLNVYKWILKKINVTNSNVSLFSAPTILNTIETGRCYRYKNDEKTISVLPGDIVIDAGVGWGDTCAYLASLSDPEKGGHLYAFDILPDAFDALDKQININPHLNNITQVQKALYNCDGKDFYSTDPSPGARLVDYETPYKTTSITIDTFQLSENLHKVDFIKMDIEGAEREAIEGAKKTILQFKPKLAISVYHLWDDLLVIPNQINAIRDDYEFYLDCTTGFGGETILYCV